MATNKILKSAASQPGAVQESGIGIDSSDNVSAVGSVTVVTGGAIRTGSTATNTLLLQAYDNDTGPGYVTFGTLTAGNTPTFDLSDSVTKSGAYIYRVSGTDVIVADGGTGLSSTTAYAVLCGGTTSTGALQSIASVGTSGQALLSNGAGNLPTFQTVAFGSIPSGYDTVTSITTTSSSLEDMTGLSTTVTLDGTAKILAIMTVELESTTLATLAAVAISINSVDSTEIQVDLLVTTKQEATVTFISGDLAAGSYTIKGRFRRVSGSGTVTTDLAQLSAVGLQGVVGPTGATGASGASASPQLQYSTIFEDVSSRYDSDSGVSGAFSTGTTGLTFQTSASANSFIKVLLYTSGSPINHPFYGPSYGNNYYVLHAARTTTGTDSQSYWGVGKVTVTGTTITYTPEHYGFKIIRVAGVDTVSATNANGTTETATSFSPTSVTATTIWAAVQGASDIKFYQDRVLVATHTTNRPDEDQTTTVTAVFAVCNSNVASQTIYKISSFTYSMDAF